MSPLLERTGNVIVRLSLIAFAFSPCGSGLTLGTRFQAGQSYDCKTIIDKEPGSGSIIEQFNGQSVTIGGRFASDLQCLSGGDHGVAFTAMSNGEPVIVKLVYESHNNRHNEKRLKFAEKRQVLFSTAAGGDAPLVPLISEGFTAERPTMYGEIWHKAAGQNWHQIHDSGGFQMVGNSSPDFMEFVKKSCEAIISLWSVGIEHGDIQRGNLMWDNQKRVVTLIDYENMEELDPGEENYDVVKLSQLMNRHRDEVEGYGVEAAAMMDDLRKNRNKYARSLQDFKEFYEEHFKSKLMLAKKK